MQREKIRDLSHLDKNLCCDCWHLFEEDTSEDTGDKQLSPWSDGEGQDAGVVK